MEEAAYQKDFSEVEKKKSDINFRSATDSELNKALDSLLGNKLVKSQLFSHLCRYMTYFFLIIDRYR